MFGRICAAAALLVLFPGRLLCQYESVVAQVSQPNYEHYLDELLFTRPGDSRGPASPQHDDARKNIRDTLASFGLTVVEEPFDFQGGTYYNITAVLPGKTRPADYHVLGAHYDSKSTPGADDDASGIAALLEAARVASIHQFEASIVFVAFDMEEPGLIGSKAWVAAHAGDRILSMLQMDMIAYNPPGATHNLIALCVPNTSANTVMPTIWAAVARYGAPVAPVQGGTSTISDHASFTRLASSVQMIEAGFYSNQNYHHASDSIETPAYIDYAFAAAATRSVVGYLAEQAGLLPDDAPVARLAPGGVVNSAGGIAGAVAPAELVTLAGSGFPANPSVVVRDAAGAIQSVSVRSSTDTRLDLVLPDVLAPGAATLTLTREDGIRLDLALDVAAVAPGVFTAASNGLGAPAAFAIRTTPDGAQFVVPLFQCAATACSPAPLDLGGEADSVVMVLYGTGIRGRADLAGVAFEVDGRKLPVQYAGAQSGSPGLDQVNIELPRDLSGRGRLSATLRVAGRAANPVVLDLGTP
jgi:uncharacterized protein (TIGR03437 family)